MIEEIVDLGFSNIELSHGMTIAKLPGIKKAYDRGLFTCSGVHNYFPSPVEVMIDAPDAYEFTSHRPFDRQRALDMTLRTLNLAAEFKAEYLVLHMGSVPMNPRKFTKALTATVAEGRQHDPDYVKAKLAFVKKREKLGPLYLHRAIEALSTIAERAAEVIAVLSGESFPAPAAADNPYLVEGAFPIVELTPEALRKLADTEFGGEVFYGLWADNVGNPEAARLLRQNGREETDHGNRLLRVAEILEG